MLLVVDDAERLTEEESNLLAALATRLPERTLVAVCFRDPPGSRHPPLADLLGRGGVYELTRLVALEALGREDLGELVASMHPVDAEVPPAFVEALWQRTAGNPFFAREVLRDLDPADLRSGRLGQRLPAGLRGVLRHRLGQLPADTRAAVSAAAVLGREVELTSLSHLLEQPRGAGGQRAGPGADQRVPRRGRPVMGRGLRVPARADAGSGVRRDPGAPAPAPAPPGGRRGPGHARTPRRT